MISDVLDIRDSELASRSLEACVIEIRIRNELCPSRIYFLLSSIDRAALKSVECIVAAAIVTRGTNSGDCEEETDVSGVERPSERANHHHVEPALAIPLARSSSRPPSSPLTFCRVLRGVHLSK